MAKRYPVEKLHKYPHLMPEDIAIWERFLDLFSNLYDSVEYDVHVGVGLRDTSGLTEELVFAAVSLLQKRIDVVGHKGDNVDIIEVKPDAGISAIGQVLVYSILYKRDFSPKGRIRKVIVTDNLWPDNEYLFKRLGIDWYVV